MMSCCLISENEVNQQKSEDLWDQSKLDNPTQNHCLPQSIEDVRYTYAE